MAQQTDCWTGLCVPSAVCSLCFGWRRRRRPTADVDGLEARQRAVAGERRRRRETATVVAEKKVAVARAKSVEMKRAGTRSRCLNGVRAPAVEHVCFVVVAKAAEKEGRVAPFVVIGSDLWPPNTRSLSDRRWSWCRRPGCRRPARCHLRR